jgi:hypothetical protein
VKLPLWLLAIVRSGSPFTVVGSLALLLPPLLSPPPDTVTVLVTPPTAPAPTPTVSVIAGALPEAAMALLEVHVTVPDELEQLQPVPVAET